MSGREDRGRRDGRFSPTVNRVLLGSTAGAAALALVFADGEEIQPGDLPRLASQRPENTLAVPTGEISLTDVLEDLERQLIGRAYEKAKGVKTETARLLGIKTSALYYKLEKYGFLQKGEAQDAE